MAGVTVREAAAQLAVTPETVRALIGKGELRAYKKTLARNSPFVVDRASVEAFDAQRRQIVQKAA